MTLSGARRLSKEGGPSKSEAHALLTLTVGFQFTTVCGHSAPLSTGLSPHAVIKISVSIPCLLSSHCGEHGVWRRVGSGGGGRLSHTPSPALGVASLSC